VRPTAAARISEALDIMRFYASEFGPPPYPTLNLALVESRIPGGHSPPGMIVVSVRSALLRGGLRDDPASFPDVPDFFIAHELAHQWWGHGVAGQNYHERWISEAFAQYAAALWVRHRRGEDAFRDMLARMGRWAIRYADKGPIYLGHRLGHIEGDPQIYRAVVYDKGAYVLHMLRQIVGEPAFRAAGMALQKENRFQKIGTDDVRAALEAASRLDLGPYFQEWVYGTSVPELRLATRSRPEAGGYRTEVTIVGSGLPGPMPLELAVSHPAGKEVRTVHMGTTGGSWTVDTPGLPRRVEVNAGRGLLVRVRRN
jgi:aminopeptidase N